MSTTTAQNIITDIMDILGRHDCIDYNARTKLRDIIRILQSSSLIEWNNPSIAAPSIDVPVLVKTTNGTQHIAKLHFLNNYHDIQTNEVLTVLEWAYSPITLDTPEAANHATG